jgi:flagellar biosynthesis anti-sigma factor FlgM
MAMRINALTQTYNAEFRKIENARKAEKDAKTGKAPIVDQTEFSSSAQRLSDTKAELQTIAASISAQPDVRMDRIAEVKQKIENGYYNSDEFIDKLANKLTKEFGFQENS